MVEFELPTINLNLPDVKTYDQVREKLENGRTILKMVERTKDPNEGLKASDFDLQSLIDAGATGLLNPIAPIAPDALSAADSLAIAGSYIENSLNPVK